MTRANRGRAIRVAPSSPYTELRKFVTWGHGRLRSLSIFGLVGILVSALTILLTHNGAEVKWGMGIGCFYGILVLWLFSRNNLIPDVPERVRFAVDFLRQRRFDPATIRMIDRRAEISIAATQIRPLFLILVLAALASLLLQSWQTSPEFIMLVAIAALLAFILLWDIDQASSDEIVRHAIAEYCCEQEQQPPVAPQQ